MTEVLALLRAWLVFLHNGGLPADTENLIELRSRRFISWFAVFGTVVAILVAIMNVIIDETHDNWFILASVGIGIGSIFLQAYSGARKVAASIILTAFWLAPTLSILDSSIYGLTAVWLLILPLLGVLLLGVYGGIATTFVSIGTIWLLAFHEQYAIHRDLVIPSPLSIGAEATATASLIFAMTLVFYFGQRKAERKLEHTVADLNKEVTIRQEAEFSAREAEQVKANFLATMSHELRTPLNGVIGAIELLEHTELNENQREFMGVVLSSGRILQQLINDIMDVSRLDAGSLQLEHKPIDLVVLCEELCESIAVTVDQKLVKVKLHIEPGLGWVAGDPIRIQQILLNLMGNSVKFTKAGQIKMSVTREAEFIRFDIEDSGIGISEEFMPKLFDTYNQASESTFRQYGGSGLGLSIVKRLIDRMAGTIEVTSEIGHGSLFRVQLPLPDAASEFAASAEVEKLSRPLKVLVVDDNTTNRYIAQKMLKKLRHEVYEASDGQEAIARAEEIEGLDLILMDVHMPNMDGIEATKEIRIREGAGKVPIIGLTANVLPGIRETLLAAGMDDYLAKPIRLTALRESIATTVDSQVKG